MLYVCVCCVESLLMFNAYNAVNFSRRILINLNFYKGILLWGMESFFLLKKRMNNIAAVNYLMESINRLC